MSAGSWPSDDALVASVRARGKEAAADELGRTLDSLTGYLTRRRLNQRVKGEPVTPGEGVSREAMLEQEVAELRRSQRRLHQGSVMEERILARLEDGISAAKPRYSPLAIPKSQRKTDQHEFVLLFSDTHASEVVSHEETLGMNEYDWDIMLGRMARMQRSVLSYQAHRPYPVKKLNVFMLGDMLSGDIHHELAVTNDRSTEEAAVQFGLDSAVWLEEFIPHFPEIHVAGVPGNHPRKTQKPQSKQAFNNGDWTSYNVAQTYLRQNSSITWNIARAAYATAIVAERWRMLLMHGDGIRSSMPGVPWGGVVRRVTTLEQQFAKARQPLDYVALGHFHTANALDGVGVKTFLNGSVKGLDEYSLKQFGSGRPPSQLLLTFHPKQGVTDVSYIDLVDPVPMAVAA